MFGDVTQQLRKANLRITAQRLAVLEALQQEGKHQDAEFLVKAGRRRIRSLSRQAVYDNLNALVSAGIVRRIEPAGRPALYETRSTDNHHHLICRLCNRTLDVDCATGVAPCLNPAADHGFRIDEAEIVFWGICPQCQESKEQNQ